MTERGTIIAGLTASAAMAATIPLVDFPIGRPLAALAVVVILALTRRRLGPVLVSPVWIVSLGYVCLALAGALFYDDVSGATGGAGIRLVLSGEVSRDTFWLILVAATAITLGAAAMSVGESPRRHQMARLVKIQTSQRARRLLFLGSLLPPVLLITGIGPARILQRSEYLATAPGALSGVSVNLAAAAALCVGYLLTQHVKASRRFVLWALVGVYGLLFFSFGSRHFALFPILLTAGACAGSLSRRSKILLAGSIAAGLYLVQLPLYLRGLDQHGLVPYAAALPGFLDETFNPGAIGQTVLISYATIGETAFNEPKIPSGDLWISLNPLPGAASGWYEISEEHRLNLFTPYPALGELGNAGMAAVVVYFLYVGVVMGYLDHRIRRYLAVGHVAVPLMILGLSGLFVLYSLQYNLRSANRLVLYAVALDVAFRVVTSLRPKTMAGSEQKSLLSAVS